MALIEISLAGKGLIEISLASRMPGYLKNSVAICPRSTILRDPSLRAEELSAWREAFLAGGEASLRSRPADARDEEIGCLKTRAGDLRGPIAALGHRAVPDPPAGYQRS